ncbi:Putative Holin-X, holin superfamily III [Desulfonatronum thiosulfatophilum]|uniref:Putative Holin-X, holin superfamily III n=1 Tax=Desulfonatronum thiosulfatophilum TaxID=617002 RepID=A0A1G6EVU9_9BACT|nr:phage holin family protein [Desulfonatronum thiosulfatophilum]SDB61528.1 Putative Holin-X, holin superfamily III [Desulfonatronum thiosulfatophilum]
MENKMESKSPAQGESFRELFEQLASNLSNIVRDEIELVIRRAQEKAAEFRGGVVALIIGAVICFIAFIPLSIALIIWLASHMAPAMAALVSGGAFLFLGVLIALIGYTKLKKAFRK